MFKISAYSNIKIIYLNAVLSSWRIVSQSGRYWYENSRFRYVIFIVDYSWLPCSCGLQFRFPRKLDGMSGAKSDRKHFINTRVH